MSHLFTLPSAATLRELLHKIPCDTGINSSVQSHLKKTAEGMKDLEKVCIIMWDEMSLTPHIQYDQSKDKLVGFEDYGDRRTYHFADHVLVFMVKGVKSGWKIPLSYYFCKDQTKHEQLMKCIKDNVRAVKDAGLILVATVCDQGSSNMTALRKLRKQHSMRTNVPEDQCKSSFSFHYTLILILFCRYLYILIYIHIYINVY